jgi:thiosulfate/3-mercaptopyruvate sulfurtransferase
MDALVTTAWLAAEQGAADLRIVDATYFLAADGRDAAAEFRAGHIPSAIFLDLSVLTDPRSLLPMMVPTADDFTRTTGLPRRGKSTRIILYDNSPYHSAARAWWMLTRVFGISQVAVLDGGLAQWIAEGRALETGDSPQSDRSFEVRKDDTAVRTKAQVLANLADRKEQVVDVRSAGRFSGAEADPRPAIARGHIPNSFNVPFGDLFASDGRWKSKVDLRHVLGAAGIDLTQPIIASCGSGLTAATLVFAAHLIGKKDVSLYDGSWTEWGADPEMPKALG